MGCGPSYFPDRAATPADSRKTRSLPKSMMPPVFDIRLPDPSMRNVIVMLTCSKLTREAAVPVEHDRKRHAPFADVFPDVARLAVVHGHRNYFESASNFFHFFDSPGTVFAMLESVGIIT